MTQKVEEPLGVAPVQVLDIATDERGQDRDRQRIRPEVELVVGGDDKSDAESVQGTRYARGIQMPVSRVAGAQDGGKD